ncbi:MAG: N-acetylglucosamine-6-phosphate deacetylase [Candidatus Njordarchaeales archaeon]
MKYKLIINASEIITPFSRLYDFSIAIDHSDKIAQIAPQGSIHETADKILEYPEGILVPGFIDIHIHGAAGADTMDASVDSLEKISRFLASKGVTGFYPTTVTAPIERIKAAIRATVEAIRKGVGGASILGIHLEGPYFSKEKAGAQDIRYLREPSVEEVKELLEVSEGYIKRVTLAPELPGAIETIKFLRSKGIVVALGHTNATYDEAIKAIDAGAKLANHIYNGMRSFYHRDPGVLGAVLTRDDVFVEMIVDEVHHHYAARDIVIRCKGVDKVALISDAIMATGLADGEYMLGEQKIIVKNGISRLPDGTIAGSTLTLDKAIKNVVRNLRVSLPDAVKMASYVPAKIMQIDHQKGSIEIGKDADLVILNKDLDVILTIVEGSIVYQKQ